MNISVTRHTLILLLASALFLYPNDPAMACDPLSLDQLGASSGVSGDTLALAASGICSSTEDFFAWVWNGSYGFPIQTQISSSSELDGLVGPVTQAVSGPVRLWKGKSISLPDAVVAGTNGTYWVHDTEVFLGNEEVTGPNFAAVAGTTTGITSTVSQGKLVLDFSTGANLQAEDLPTKSGPHKNSGGEGIAVYVVIPACGPPDQDPDDPDGQDDGSGLGITVRTVDLFAKFKVRCFGSDACTQSPFDNVARAMTQQFSSLGVTATPDVAMQQVVIERQSCPIEVGFATAVN